MPAPWPGAGQRLPHDARRSYPGRYGQEVWKRWEDDPDFELALPYYGFDMSMVGGVHQLVSKAIRLGDPR